MAVTVQNVQDRIAGIVDQSNSIATSSDDYALRLSYINRRERTWSETGKWQSLVKEFNTLTSTISGNTSISLPADYRSMAILPRISFDGVDTRDFQEIRPQDEAKFDPLSSQYVKVMGNPQSGYTMIVNSSNANRQLVSGASIKVLYYSTPASLTTATDVVTCPNPEYLIQGVIADVWESKEDARFQGAKVEANLILQNMLEFENTPSEQSYSAEVHTVEQRTNFRWGR